MTLLAVKDERPSINAKAKNGTALEEAIAFCPRCKALQTVWVKSHTLMPTRKFTQEGTKIYHDCGSRQPCRLYYSW